MSKIKVGQMYRSCITNTIYVVSNMINGISVIFSDGSCGRTLERLIREADLIAEYPTWQEAVNSKEFKGEK